jgi:competence protein ComEA
LSQLEGIGPTLAQRIIADRKQNGPFADVEDLVRVRGIGPKTIVRLKPWLTVGP